MSKQVVVIFYVNDSDYGGDIKAVVRNALPTNVLLESDDGAHQMIIDEISEIIIKDVDDREG